MAFTKPSKQKVETPEAVEEVAPEVAPKEPPKGNLIYVAPTAAAMYHPFFKIQIEGSTLVPEIDSWLASQIDAGKVKRV